MAFKKNSKTGVLREKDFLYRLFEMIIQILSFAFEFGLIHGYQVQQIRQHYHHQENLPVTKKAH